ncbi:MAG: NADH-quinone oxidoreductase subunit N [Legionellales bacterium]|nr:NADH-quinone oxidoreductase subunit N [Legionellales bacterium]
MILQKIPAIAESSILIFSIFILLLGKIFHHQKKKIISLLVNLGMLIGIILLVYSYELPSTVYFYGEFSHNFSSIFLKIVLLVFAWLIFIYVNKEIDEILLVEFYVLALLSIIGMMVMISSATFLSLFLGIELMSLPIYTLVALNKGSLKSSEAAIKYFLMGAVASAIMLYGISILYGISGSIDYFNIQKALKNLLWIKSGNYSYIFALLFILTALGFKLALVPYHAWVPDVYQGSPINSTIFLASVPKLAIFAIAAKILIEVFPILVEIWQTWLLGVGILSIIIGNLAALIQTNIKRLLGYSAIAHIGYVILGLGATTIEGYSAGLFYLITYLIMVVGVFAVLVLLDKQLSVEMIQDLQGLNTRDPVIAGAMLLILFSMAGLPPLVGFLAKLFVLKALFNVGYIVLAIIALLMTVVGVCYYIRIIKVMYFEEPIHTAPITISADKRILVVGNALVLVFLGISPLLLMEYCNMVFYI